VIALPWGIVLDADVLLRRGPRDLLLYLAAGGVVDAIWSHEILVEVARNFPGGPERFASLKENLARHFPTARKSGFDHRMAQLRDTDAKDRHVMALAIEYEADVVTFNTRDYGTRDAEVGGIQVYTPDHALMTVVALDPEAVLEVVKTSFENMQSPAPAWDRYVRRLHDDGLPRVATWLRDTGRL
jgi:hypothetical protein